MRDLSRLSARMQSDWDRRIKHDPRFWMSDGYRDDQSMWASGERDFHIICKDIPSTGDKVALEVGCGVGRILKSACKNFKHVIGLDVSEAALEQASTYLKDTSNLRLIKGNGIDLSEVGNESIDVAYAFAAFGSLPTDVCANYLNDIWRVLKPNGVFRLQCYVGEEQQVEASDTLHLRCYRRDNFEKAIKLAGFELEFIEDLVLPIQVSFEEIGIRAVICSLKRNSQRVNSSSAEISQTLLPGGEKTSVFEMPTESLERGGELEAWMALNYADELADRGDISKAKETLDYVGHHCRTNTIDIRDLLDRIVAKIDKLTVPPMEVSTECYDANLKIIRERFPKIGLAISELANCADLQIKQTPEGPSLFYKEQTLDHPDKPRTAGEVSMRRSLQENRFADAKGVLVFGFGSGYHIEALFNQGQRKVVVIEPSAHVLKAALGSRDLREVLSQIEGLEVGKVSDESIFTRGYELIVRPQSQAVWPELCSQVRSRFYGARGVDTLHPRIAVLGPFQGGTLPIAGYCSRALSELEQRMRLYDMSGFASAYHLFDQFIFDKYRQLNSRGHYIEMCTQLIMDSVAEKPIDILICMAQAPFSIRGLQELRNRGVITVLWFVEDYLRFTYWKDVAAAFDFVFTIQTGECIKAIKAAGAGEVHYLPVACDPMIHRKVEITEAEKARWGSPISFVGAGYHNRQQMFAGLAGYPFKIWGTEWPECRPFDRMLQENGRRLAPEEYVRIFNSTDININLHSSTEKDGVDPAGDFINPRTFELAACGAFQLVDERSLLSSVFEPGKELITFHNAADLKDKIAYYLAHPEERSDIALAGQRRALREHTYAQRLKQMLAVIYSSKFEELKRREEAGSWHQMLRRAKPNPELYQRCQAAFKRGEEATLDGLVTNIVQGQGKLSETEQKLLFLFHVRKQIIRMSNEEAGIKQ